MSDQAAKTVAGTEKAEAKGGSAKKWSYWVTFKDGKTEEVATKGQLRKLLKEKGDVASIFHGRQVQVVQKTVSAIV